MRSFSILKHLNKPFGGAIIATSFMGFAILMGISVGSVPIPFSHIIDVFYHHLIGTPYRDVLTDNIVMNMRFPRVLLAFLIGSALALSGVCFQSLLKNPLADPYTLGVSSGASVGAVATIFFSFSLPMLGSYTLPVMSMIGATITLFLVLSVATAMDNTLRIETIVLTGIIVGSFLGAIISLFIALTGEELRDILSWLMGSVAMRGWEFVQMIAPFYVVGVVILLMQARELNAFAFGEEQAQYVGVNVKRRKVIILITSSMLTGIAVSVSGVIGFVGLVIPHMTRLLWGANHRYLMPLALLNGGSFLVLADCVARSIIAPRELPIGVITAFIGAPLFALLYFNRQRRKK